MADGVVITPSHNPPDDGGFKYTPAGGPADTLTTKSMQARTNEILKNGLREVKRISLARAMKAETTHLYDYITPYVSDLSNVIDIPAIKASGLKIGVDPMGGAALVFGSQSPRCTG